VRKHGQGDQGSMSITDFIAYFNKEKSASLGN